MCHLLLALPILALPVFWLLPVAAALPIYLLAATAGVLVFVYGWLANRLPVVNGAQSMLGAVGRVVRAEGPAVTLYVRSELWSAESEQDALGAGDSAVVVGVRGLRLKVRKQPAGTPKGA